MPRSANRDLSARMQKELRGLITKWLSERKQPRSLDRHPEWDSGYDCGLEQAADDLQARLDDMPDDDD